VLKRKPSVVP